MMNLIRQTPARRTVCASLLIAACTSGVCAATSPDIDSAVAVEKRKREFLGRLADDWAAAGHPIQWKHEEWKFDEIEPNWSGALAAMHLKRNREEVSKADAFFAAMPLDEKIDPDMRVCEAIHAYYLFRDDPSLSPAARKRLLDIMHALPAPRRINPSIWEFGATENHAFMGHTWNLMTAQLDRDHNAVAEMSRHIALFIIEHIRKGWLEYNSPCYVEKEIGCLVMVAEWAEDPRLRQIAELGLDVLFAEHAALNLEGMLCGPACRVYQPAHDGILPAEFNHNSRRDAQCSGSYPCMYMLFDQGRPHYYGVLGAPLLATSRYVPPKAVTALATAGPERGCYEFKARRPGRYHNLLRAKPGQSSPPPEVFSSRVYAWVTPDFILGSFQEVDGLFGASRALPLSSVLRISGSTRRAVYADLVPAEREASATSTVDCVQYKNVVLGRGSVGQAYLATKEFDEVAEQQGWIFARAGGTFLAYRVIGAAWKWAGADDPSVFGDFVKFENPQAPFVLEVAGTSDYKGDFSRFRADVLDNTIKQEENTVSYESCSQGNAGPSAERFTLTLRYGQLPLLDGQPLDLEGYGTFESPYLNSAWDSGIVNLRYGSERLMVNVTRLERVIRTEETITPLSLPYQTDCEKPDAAWVPFLNYWRLKPQQWYWSNDGGKPGGCLRHDAARGVDNAERGAHDAMILLRGGETWADYSFEADARSDKGTLGLWFRADMEDEGGGNGRRVQGYYLVIDPAHKKCRLWRARKDGLQSADAKGEPGPAEVNHFSNPLLIAEQQTPDPIAAGSWIHLHVEVKGSKIACSVNGQTVITTEDGTYPSGSVGLFAYKGMDVRFDNIRVSP
ncbi:MAG TPA: DUF1080 domain-containing protein [Phycisphaerae bacterium]|nr:DUF1080 domain-containing protein [Phycisphaerae bacterium]HRR84778.1 DUF1080 domain-containing protein [Phycisphaerae bacterium]